MAGRRRARRLPERHLRPEGHHRGLRASARSARRRSTCARRNAGDRRRAEPAQATTSSSSRSRRAACTSAAPSATSRPPQRFICPCHGGVYDFRGKVDGGPPVRPLDRFYTRVAQRPGRGRPALLGQPRAPALLVPATRASRSTASASTCTRGRFSTPEAGLGRPAMKLPKLPPRRSPALLPAARSGPATAEKLGPAGAGQGGRDHAPSTGSTSAPRSPAAVRWMMFRKVPKGTNWFYTLGSATMFAFLSQAVTGVFLAMYYDPSPRPAPTSRCATSPTRSSSASSCTACTSGARR